MRLSLRGPLGHWSRLAREPAFLRRRLEIRRLERLPRYTPTVTTLLGRPFEIADSLTFLEMYEAIWERQIYRFPAERPNPLILDGGANVGLSVAFFKEAYPLSSIVAFEPDPVIFAVLERNVRRWGFSSVQLVPRALWTEEVSLPFYSEGSDAGRIARAGDPAGEAVSTVRLSDYLDRRVDFLKLDIEQGETAVLEDCVARLGNVDRLFVEHHGSAAEPQELPRLLGLLSGAGFRWVLHAGNDSQRPFEHRKLNMGNDVQVEVFAYRETPRLRIRTDNSV